MSFGSGGPTLLARDKKTGRDRVLDSPTLELSR
jgi:hypothetical protein